MLKYQKALRSELAAAASAPSERPASSDSDVATQPSASSQATSTQPATTLSTQSPTRTPPSTRQAPPIPVAPHNVRAARSLARGLARLDEIERTLDLGTQGSQQTAGTSVHDPAAAQRLAEEQDARIVDAELECYATENVMEAPKNANFDLLLYWQVSLSAPSRVPQTHIHRSRPGKRNSPYCSS